MENEQTDLSILYKREKDMEIKYMKNLSYVHAPLLI